MSDTKFFRKYLDILNEGPPPGVGPNAPARPATPQQPAQPNAAPSQYQQAKDAVGQQVQNYKDISGQIDQGVKQGQLDQKTASAAKSDLAGTMMRGGYEAGKAAMQGRDPSTAYVGSAVRSIGNTVANSGLDSAMKKAGADISKYRGPNAQDIRNDPAFKKASPEQQAQALKDFDAIRNLSDEEYNYYTGGKAFKELGGRAAQAGQDMIDQKDWGKGPSSGYSPETNKLFGLDPTKQATDAEMQAAATGTAPASAQPAPAQAQPAQPQGAQQPTTEEKDDMDNRQLMRKYMDYLDEAPATAINPNDTNAASFGKQINAPGNQPPGLAAATTGGGYTNQANRPATQTNVDTRATAQRDKLAQQMASGKINTPAPQTVNPNQQYGGGYDPNKVQYASGGKPAPTASATQSAALDASKKNAFGGGTQVASSQPVNNQSSGYTAQSQAQNIRGASAQPATPQSSLSSQYVAANQPKSATAAAAPAVAAAAPPQPSLASQYVSANQPQTATASAPTQTSDQIATQALNAQDQGVSGQSKGIPAVFGQVAEEKGNDDDELLKSIIRLIKQ